MNDFWNTKEGLLGRKGEDIVCECLKRLGWKINRTADYSGPDGNQAPMADDIEGAWAILPDINGMKKGCRRWFEVKTKSKPRTAIIPGWVGHGIALLNLQHYRRIQKESGCDVWIMIYEVSTNDILSAPLNHLEKKCFHYDPKIYPNVLDADKGGSVNFPREQFELFAVAEPHKELFKMMDGRWLPNNVYVKRERRQKEFGL